MRKERKLEHTPHTVQNPYPSSPQPSFGQPRSCRPMVQNPCPSLPLNHFQKKKKRRTEPRATRGSRADEIAHTTTPDRTTTSNPNAHHNPKSHHRIQPQIAPPHPIPNRTGLVAPQHRRDHTYDSPMPDLSLSRSTSPFPSIVNHSLFLTLSSSL